MMPHVEKRMWRRLMMAVCSVALCSTPTLGFSVPHSGVNLRLQDKGWGFQPRAGRGPRPLVVIPCRYGIKSHTRESQTLKR